MDDNHDVADMIARLLSIAGYEARTAYDPVEALALVGDVPPQAAILDIGLPVMDGYTLARAIRARLSNPPILIALTGYSQDRDRIRSQEAGFAAHLVKPVDADRLLKTIEELLAKAEARLAAG